MSDTIRPRNSEQEPRRTELPDSSSGGPASRLSWPVFIGSTVVILLFVVSAWLLPEQAEYAITTLMTAISDSLGWYYILTGTVVFIFVVGIAVLRSGRIRMGPDHSRPKYNIFTWASMLFAAGISTDLMFFAVSGPATNYLFPPEGDPASAESARQAALWTMFHYGIVGWGMYALMGMAFGLFAYRYHMPLAVRSALAPIFGRRIKGAAGDTMEVAATIGAIFGIATSLGIGVVFLNYGLSIVFGLRQNFAMLTALVAISVFIATLSTVSGVDKGIRRLSELNVILALALIVYLIVVGDTAHLLNGLVQNIGDFFGRLPDMMLNTFAFSEGQSEMPASEWRSTWTVFFWAWWVAWAPFVGLFLARISRGRTLREYVAGTLLLPFGFILLWISVFGNAAVQEFRTGNDSFLDAAIASPESGFWLLMQQNPGATFGVGLALLTGLLFYITSADSGALVIANFTSKTEHSHADPAPWLRVFWAVATGVLTLAMLYLNGIATLQAATVIIGLPFSIVLYLIMISIFRTLKIEITSRDSRHSMIPSILSDQVFASRSPENWRQRLKKLVQHPSAAQTAQFIENTAAPALTQVAAAMREQGSSVECDHGRISGSDLPFIDLRVNYDDAAEFMYQVYPVAHPVPRFAKDTSRADGEFFRAEVFMSTGSTGRDVYGWSTDRIITDVLDALEQHLSVLEHTEELPGVLGDEGLAPSEWNEWDDE